MRATSVGMFSASFLNDRTTETSGLAGRWSMKVAVSLLGNTVETQVAVLGDERQIERPVDPGDDLRGVVRRPPAPTRRQPAAREHETFPPRVRRGRRRPGRRLPSNVRVLGVPDHGEPLQKLADALVQREGRLVPGPLDFFVRHDVVALVWIAADIRLVDDERRQVFLNLLAEL